MYLYYNINLDICIIRLLTLTFFNYLDRNILFRFFYQSHYLKPYRQDYIVPDDNFDYIFIYVYLECNIYVYVEKIRIIKYRNCTLNFVIMIKRKRVFFNAIRSL